MLGDVKLWYIDSKMVRNLLQFFLDILIKLYLIKCTAVIEIQDNLYL